MREIAATDPATVVGKPSANLASAASLVVSAEYNIGKAYSKGVPIANIP